MLTSTYITLLFEADMIVLFFSPGSQATTPERAHILYCYEAPTDYAFSSGWDVSGSTDGPFFEAVGAFAATDPAWDVYLHPSDVEYIFWRMYSIRYNKRCFSACVPW